MATKRKRPKHPKSRAIAGLVVIALPAVTADDLKHLHQESQRDRIAETWQIQNVAVVTSTTVAGTAVINAFQHFLRTNP